MKKILNALFLTIITLVTFSCSDVPAPYDINGGGNGEGPALTFYKCRKYIDCC